MIKNFQDLLSIRGKLAILLILFLGIFYLFFNFKNNIYSPKIKNKYNKSTICILFSDHVSSPYEPPYCDIGIINEKGFYKITNNNYFNISLSLGEEFNQIFFESKREGKLLGLSGQSKLMIADLVSKKVYDSGIDIEYGARNLKKYKEYLFYEVLYDTILQLKAKHISENKVIDISNFPSNALIDCFFNNDKLIIYNYLKSFLGVNKIQALDLPSGRILKIDQNLLEGMSFVKSSEKMGFLLSKLNGQNELELYRLNSKFNRTEKLGSIDISTFEECELFYVEALNNMAFISYTEDDYNLIHFDGNTFTELISFPVIWEVLMF